VAYGLALFHDAKREAQTGIAASIVKQYYSLPVSNPPSLLSPYRTVSSTERFEDAPIHLIEYADFLCPDCLYLTQQLAQLKQEFKGRVNIAFQFFPLEAKCNDVVDKDRHPGACDLAYIAAYDPARFAQIHDEIFGSFKAAKDPEWRARLARKYNAEAALIDPRTRDLVRRIIQTGREYEKTSDKYPFGIRSTPTMILNNRMIIGTLPYVQLRAIFQALAEEGRGEGGAMKFLEHWVPARTPK
jgi:protein-disulfide isomerase